MPSALIPPGLDMLTAAVEVVPSSDCVILTVVPDSGAIHVQKSVSHTLLSVLGVTHPRVMSPRYGQQVTVVMELTPALSLHAVT